MSSFAVIQGASRGIGLNLVKSLLERTNLNIVGTCRDPMKAHDNLIKLVQNSDLIKERVAFLPLDLTQESSIEKAAQHVSSLGKEKQQPRPIRILVNSSGYLLPEKSFKQVDLKDTEHHFKVNAIGPMLMAKHFGALMGGPLNSQSSSTITSSGIGTSLFKNDHAIFANISARTGSIGDNKLGGWHSYRMSKAALNQLTRTLAIELGRKGVIVVSLHPGTVDTDLSRKYVKNIPSDKLFSPYQSANYLLDVMETLTLEKNGLFFDYAGKPIEW